MAKYVTSILVLVVAVLAVALFVRGGEVMTALAISTTNSTIVTVNITPSQVTCSAMTCYDADDTIDQVDLVGGYQRFVKCNASCNAPNGWGYVNNYTGTIGRSGVSCTPASNLDCYQNDSCYNHTAFNTTLQYIECSYLFWFNSQNTTISGSWTGSLKAGDNGGAVSPEASDTIGVNTLLATGVNSTLAFGSKSAATNDSTCLAAQGTNVYNYGNIQMDVAVNGSAMTCNGADNAIPAEYIHGNITPGAFYIDSYALSATLAGPDVAKSRFDVNITASATTVGPPAVTARTLYWGIGIPAGVTGNCQSTIWFAAQSS